MIKSDNKDIIILNNINIFYKCYFQVSGHQKILKKMYQFPQKNY